jgi:outer membrane protein OmpA-like peptidoglycan-associated protein
MRNWIITLIVLSSFALEISAQKTTQWATRLVRYSSESDDEFYNAKQILGPPNSMPGYTDSPYSWSPKEADGNRDEFIHVEFGLPMRVSQFAVVESLNPGAISQVELIDTKGKSHTVYTASSFKPSYTPYRIFTKTIPFTDYEVLGMKVHLKPSAIKGFNQIDAIAISNSTETIKPKVNNLTYSDPVERAENLGLSVNSKYSERLPIISPDGNALYFTRKYHPENIGDLDKDDIWVARNNGDNNWTNTRNIGEPLNNDLHNFVIAISPDNSRLYVASAYKKGEKDGVAVAKRSGNGWGKPVTLNIENMYNKSKFAGYHMSMDGNILLLAIEREDSQGDRDLYVSFKKGTNEWSEPKNLGKVVNSIGMESSVFLAADNRTIYFSSNGFEGYGGLDMYISHRLDDSWENWSTPKNLGRDINTPGNDYNYTIPASGDYAYFSSDFMSNGQSDLFRIRLPKEARPDPVMIINHDIAEDFEEDLDGDIVVVNDDPTLQKEVDDLKNRLQYLNDELTKMEGRKESVNIPTERKPTYDKPTQHSSKTNNTATAAKVDPELERLKKKYNTHLEKDEEDATPSKPITTTNSNTSNQQTTTQNPPTSSKKEDENEALKRKLRILNGEEDVAQEEKPIAEVPETPKKTTKPAEPNVDVAAMKEEIRQSLKEELRADVKSELKRDMIDDVRADLESEMRISLEDDLKKKVEDDLKATLEDGVKADLKKKLQSDVEDDLRNELSDEVRAEIEKELRAELMAEVKQELRNDMEYRIKKEMETQIRRELETKIRAQLEEEYAEKLKNIEAQPVEEEEEEDVFIVPLRVGEIIPMDNIFFDANETTIKENSQDELLKVLTFLNQHPNLIVEIGGHTNSWCDHEFANKLSDGRAKEVKAYLISQGISATRIQSHGYGKTQPIADNKTVEGRKKNQRVEMKIVEILK